MTGPLQVYIAAIEGYVPQDIIHTFRAFLEFCYLVCRNVITAPTLTAIEDALARFHSYRKVFRNVQVVATFSLPRQHSMKHYPYLIRQFGTPNGLCLSITKSKHIKAVKRPYWHTNRFQALRQMLVINQRLDKFAAARADLEKRGMLRGTCLSHVSNNQGHEDSADESTESCKEDTDNSPMSVEAHVSLAQTYCMSLLIASCV